MGTLVLTWSQVAVIVVAVFAVYGLEMAFFYWRLRQHHFTERFAWARLRQLERAVEALQRARPDASGAVAVPLASVASEAAPSLPETEPAAAQPPSAAEAEAEREADAAASPYTRAIELARTGCDAARVARECGLSRGEADLIVSLYGRSTQR